MEHPLRQEEETLIQSGGSPETQGEVQTIQERVSTQLDGGSVCGERGMKGKGTDL